MYQQWVQPTLESKEPVIDRWLAETKGSVGDLVGASVSKLVVVVQTKALQLLEQAKHMQIKAATPDDKVGGGGCEGVGRLSVEGVGWVVCGLVWEYVWGHMSTCISSGRSRQLQLFCGVWKHRSN